MTRTLRFDGATIVGRDGTTAIPAPEAVPHGWVVPPGDVTIEHGLGPVRFYRHGWNSWSPTGWTSLADSPLRIYGDAPRRLTADDAATDRPDRHEGSGLGALELPDGRVLLLGALGLGTPRVGASGRDLRGTTESDGDGWFVGLGDEHEVLAAYATLLRDRLGRPGATPVTTLWCSWYSFFEDIDEQRLVDVVTDLGDLPLDVVQIDDGWEQIVGDWDPNERFPDGMSGLAAQITARGSRPGLWLAPLICLPGSRTAQDHPEWLVQDPDGGPLVAGYNWDSHYHVLDTTRPDVQEHLDRVVRAVVGWGFRYLKLDFLYAGAIPGVRSTSTPREQVYREALALIRRAAGPDVYLLGCGAPMLPSIGLLDGVRVGPDTASDWVRPGTVADPSHEGGLNALTAAVARLWMADLFQVDPDVAYFRSRETTLTPTQRHAIADLAVITGFRSTSDPVAWLDERERGDMEAFLRDAPEVHRVGREQATIDGRLVDFGPMVREAAAGRAQLTEATTDASD